MLKDLQISSNDIIIIIIIIKTIVVGALGTVASLNEYMSMLNIEKKEVDKVQFFARLKNARILRKNLDI